MGSLGKHASRLRGGRESVPLESPWTTRGVGGDAVDSGRGGNGASRRNKRTDNCRAMSLHSSSSAAGGLPSELAFFRELN